MLLDNFGITVTMTETDFQITIDHRNTLSKCIRSFDLRPIAFPGVYVAFQSCSEVGTWSMESCFIRASVVQSLREFNDKCE